jgi:crossover junction endodeoxyribonuclease RuvC
MPERFFRSALPDERREMPKIDTSVAHIARVYDYWLGGKDNFAADREVGDKVLAIHPETVLSVQANRRFLARSVRFLAAEAGIRQFLDVGTGLPSANNTHEVAQAIAPESRVLYVDNDPIVLVHARALLTSSPEGETGYLEADMKDATEILGSAAQILDFSQPVGVMLVAVLHMLRDEEDPWGIVDRFTAAVPRGSYLVISHLASDVQRDVMAEMGRQLNESMPQQFVMRSRAQVTGFFRGLTVLDPGVVLTHEWRPDSHDDAKTPGILWAGVARKDLDPARPAISVSAAAAGCVHGGYAGYFVPRWGPGVSRIFLPARRVGGTRGADAPAPGFGAVWWRTGVRWWTDWDGVARDDQMGVVTLGAARTPARVLGVDPGLTRCGLGVVDGLPGRPPALVAAGVVRTGADEDVAARLLAIEQEIDRWLTEYRPDTVAVERVFSQHNVRTVMGTAQAGAVAIVCAARRGLPVSLHTPSEVKAAVTGNGRADKDQVTAMVMRLLRMAERPRPADAADALALAICHLWRAPAIRMRQATALGAGAGTASAAPDPRRLTGGGT